MSTEESKKKIVTSLNRLYGRQQGFVMALTGAPEDMMADARQDLAVLKELIDLMPVVAFKCAHCDEGWCSDFQSDRRWPCEECNGKGYLE